MISMFRNIFVNFKNNYVLGFFIALIFFAIGVLTVSHYGINIDEPNHFLRGQSLFHYLITGNKTYNDLSPGSRRSAWQDDGQNGIYYLSGKKNASHPALNDIGAASFNYIFYQKLGIIGDLEAYHLFEIFTSSLLVFLIYVIISTQYGKFAAIVGTLSLALYPLFYGETHFNIKDPVETTFFSFTIFLLYLGISKKKVIYFILSGVSFAAALGTKFNAFFIPVIIIPYVIIRFFPGIKESKLSILKKIPLRIYLSLITAALASITIYIYFNPQLWTNPLGRFIEQFSYYGDIGTGTNYQNKYLLYGWNLYPWLFVAISTPLIILFYATLGLGITLKKISREKSKFSLLVILWFIIPLLRVSVPGTSIYSGVRQIMEYIPAMAILSGLGAVYVRSLLTRYVRIKTLASIIILMSFIPLIYKLWQLHPNENVFINPLVGGLRGAVEKRIPGAAESMGNVYLQGMLWLNEHAEKNARFKPLIGLTPNIPRQFIRKDLVFGGFFSGMDKEGEYLIEMLSVDWPPPDYRLEYLKTFMDPVYVVRADGVPILMIWKNDKEHTKEGYYNKKEEKNMQILGGKNEGFISIILEKPSFITRLKIDYGNKNCIQDEYITASFSLKKGDYYTIDLINQLGHYASYSSILSNDNSSSYLFAAFPAKSIKIIPADPSSCLLENKDIFVESLRDTSP